MRNGIGLLTAPESTAFRLGVSLLLAVLLLAVYRLSRDSRTYSRTFLLLLLLLPAATTLLPAAIRVYPALSVGAVSVLAFLLDRTGIRTPRELCFAAWSIAIGISSALGAYAVGLAGTLLAGILMLAIGRNGPRRTLVLRGQTSRLESAQALLDETRGSFICSRDVGRDGFELVCELRLSQGEEEELVRLLRHMDGIEDVSITTPEDRMAC